jgi:hypothetical protein
MDQLRCQRKRGHHLSLGQAREIPDPMPDPGEAAAQRLDLATAYSDREGRSGLCLAFPRPVSGEA